MGYRKVNYPHKFKEDAVFACVMDSERICRQMIERIFPDKKIKGIKLVGRSENNKSMRDLLVETQKEIATGIFEKRVRFDVLFYGEEEWFNIEMQTSNERNLAKRMRYYASRLDTYQTKRGADYNKMKNAYVIFICTYDPFGLGKAVYNFEKYDVKNHLPMNDGAYTIVLNTTSEEGIDDGLKSVFRYVDKNELNEEDDFLKEIDSMVDKLNQDEDWGQAVMTLEEKMNQAERRGHTSGLAEGRKFGLAEGEKRGRKVGLTEGKREEQLEIARKLKEEGADKDFISRITGLGTEEIKKI